MDDEELKFFNDVDDSGFPEIDQNDITGRAHLSHLSEVVDEFQNEIGTDLLTFVGKTINVYKFRKTSGVNTFSSNGQGGLEINPDDKAQYIQIYSSTEPVTIVWENSTKLFGDGHLKISKELKVGTYYRCYYAQEDLTGELQDDNITILDIDYKTQFSRKTITLKSKEWEVKLNDQLNSFYIILDPTAEMPQILELKTFSNLYHHTESQKFLYSVITFESVNFKFTNTGRNILEAIQFAAPGEEYAYPYELFLPDGQTRVILDQNKMGIADVGVHTFQLEFNNATMLSSISLVGRKKNIYRPDLSSINEDDPENNVYRFDVNVPTRLFLLNTNPPKVNPFAHNVPNGTNVFNTLINLEKVGVWASYKQAWTDNRTGEYNILEQKEVRGGIKHNFDTRNANAEFHLWTDKLLIPMADFFNDIQVKTDIQSLNYVKDNFLNTNVNLELHNWFNVNSLYNSNVEALNYSYRELVRWSLKDTWGIFGGLLDVLMGGLDWGWTTTNAIGGMFKRFNFTQPWATFEDHLTLFGQNYKSKIQPIDFFDDQKQRNMLPVNTNIYCAYNFGLTNYFKTTNPQEIFNSRPVGKGGQGIWNNLYLGQTHYEDKTTIFNGIKKLNIDLSTFKAYPSLDENDFIVDALEFKAIASTDYKISFYNRLDQEIYGYYGKTIAKTKGDLRLWKNRMNFNYYDRINSFGNVTYPNPLEPDIPQLQQYVRFDYQDEIMFDRAQTRMFDINFFGLNRIQDLPRLIRNGNKASFDYYGIFFNIDSVVFYLSDDYRPSNLMPNPNYGKVYKIWFNDVNNAFGLNFFPRFTRTSFDVRNNKKYSLSSFVYNNPFERAFVVEMGITENNNYRIYSGEGWFEQDWTDLTMITKTIQSAKIINPKRIIVKFKEIAENAFEFDVRNMRNGEQKEITFMIKNVSFNGQNAKDPYFSPASMGFMKEYMKYNGGLVVDFWKGFRYKVTLIKQRNTTFLVKIVPQYAHKITLRKWEPNKGKYKWIGNAHKTYYQPSHGGRLNLIWNNNRWEVDYNLDKYYKGDTISPPLSAPWNMSWPGSICWLLESIIIENSI